MRVRRVRIYGFRGVRSADLFFPAAGSQAVVGPNGCGKSTLVDAMSLALGRPRLVRQLTEHDFYGSDPGPADRIRILVTLTGFGSADPDAHQHWFRDDRAVPKWIDESGVEHAEQRKGSELCVTLGFAARFDCEELEIEQIRYFHDDDSVADPFMEPGGVRTAPHRLVNEIGYFVLPARRTWDAVASFNSDLFRRTISNSAGIPASAIIKQRDALRSPTAPVESAPELQSLTDGLNEQLARLVLGAPKFQLRVTAGDSEAVLHALLPHYAADGGPSLPAHRHGTGLLSLQTLLLLLEVGKARCAKGQSFVLALEEPELHLAPGVESRLVAEALRVAGQVICTTHSPEVARLFEPTATLVMWNDGGAARARRLLDAPLQGTAPNWERKLYGLMRGSFVSALMHPYVLVPEGRLDVEWIRRIASIGDRQLAPAPPLGCVYGLAPTEDAKVEETVARVAALRPRVVAVVDGDSAGDAYAKNLAAQGEKPDAIFQWPAGWTVENVVHWIMEGGQKTLLSRIQKDLDGHAEFASLEDLRDQLRVANDRKKHKTGLKDDHVVHDAILAAIDEDAGACKRASDLCGALVAVALGNPQACPLLALTSGGTVPAHYRFVP